MDVEILHRTRISGAGGVVVAVMVAIMLGATSLASGDNDDGLPARVPARVLRVIDGDTIVVRAKVWINQEIETAVRVAGVDTPELRSACAAEKRLARAAQRYVEAVVMGRWVALTEIHYGKFGGRVVGRVWTADGNDLAWLLIRRGLGRAYRGGARTPWCVGARLAQ